MIYTKGKVGHYMGNTDILTTSLPDADTENTTEHSTIFDDVFRTIAQKMPQLLIPLINEVFHTSYSEEEQFEQLRNEHYEKYGTVITDSIIRIGGHIYHLECQSSKDRTMVIRMFEYDISIALEHAVIFFGRLFDEGKVDLTRTVAVAGSEVSHPAYVDALVGTPLRVILNGQLKATEHVRILNGNPLTGRKATLEDYLGAHTSEVTVIPEGDNADEFMGWILPRTKQFSVSRSYFSWLMGKNREYDLDARVKGGERHMIMSGEYDKVLPMDIYGEYLIKAIITGDIDRQEQLGIYEVSPEDFAVAEFVDSSKLELQKIVRNGLDILRKENA